MNGSGENEARYALRRAQEEFRLGHRGQAYRWAAQAAQFAPHLEEPWLLLGSVASPNASVAYLKRALEINPHSQRAARGLAWAEARARNAQQPQYLPGAEETRRTQVFPVSQVKDRANPYLIQLALILTWMVVLVFTVIPLSGYIFNYVIPTPGQVNFAGIPQTAPLVSATLAPSQTITVTASSTSTLTPTLTETPAPSDTPALPPTETAVPVVEITPIQAYQIQQPGIGNDAWDYNPQPVPAGSGGERWIDVNLSQQMVYAYEGDQIVNSFLVSTGTAKHPTVTGSYQIYIKLKSDDMVGPGYNLPNVPYVMYFYKGYSFHGTYWHSNFGTPMSHGCINMRTSEAQWLFNWASIGTQVNVHY